MHVSAFALLACCGGALAQPANNDCGANAASFTIPATGGVVSQSTTDTAGWTRDGSACSGSSGTDVYWYFTPASAGPWQIDICTGGSFDSVLSVHNNICPVSSSNYANGLGAGVACDDDTTGCGTGTSSIVTLSLTPGNTYIIRVARFSSNTASEYTLTVANVSGIGACCTPAGVCSEIAQGSCTGTSVFQGIGTVCSPNPCPQPPVGACCAPGGVCTEIAQTSCTGTSVFQGAATVCSPNPCPQPPGNDLCANASTAVLGGNSGNAATATNDGRSTCDSSAGKDVWWLFNPGVTGQYRIETCGGSPDWDSVVSVHTACAADTSTQISGACKDQGCGTGNLSRLDLLTLNAGTNYYIRVAAWSSSTSGVGEYVLNISQAITGACCATTTCSITEASACTGASIYQGDNTTCTPTNPCAALSGACCAQNGACAQLSIAFCASPNVFQGNGSVCSPNPCPQPPSNDACTSASVASLGVNSGTAALSTNDGRSSCDTSAGKDVWWVFTPASTGTYHVSTCSGLTSWDSVLSIHTSCAADASTQVSGACADQGCTGNAFSNIPLVTLNAGVPYFIRVAGWSSSVVPGAYELSITQVTTGACCSGTSGTTCSITANDACTGIFLGDNTTCTPNFCAGACCDPATGLCTLVADSFSCAGNFQGAGTACSPNPCPPVGACCVGTSCSITLEANCAGTWQGAGSVCSGYTFASVSAAFEDISSTGTIAATVSGCDDCGETIAIGFNFTYLGTTYSDVWVCANGFIQFGGANNVTNGNAVIPTPGVPNTFIAPLWDDFDLDEFDDGAGDVYTLVDGAPGNRRLVVSWQGAAQFLNTDSNSFQVILYESNGKFEFRYGAITPQGVAGDYTVGYENADGTSGVALDAVSLGSGGLAFLASEVVPCQGSANGRCCIGSRCAIVTVDQCVASGGAGVAFASGASDCNASDVSLTPCCFADYNKTGGVSVQDIFDFLGGWFAGSVNANVGGDGVATPTVQDIFDFLAAWFTGGCA